MFTLQKYEDRLAAWSAFRQTLENADDPVAEAIAFYNSVSRVSINTDPWDKSTWPDPWELVLENQYCDFCILLGICYSLQLTDRFSGSDIEIYIGTDKENSKTLYLLCIDDIAISLDTDIVVGNKTKMCDGIAFEKKYAMPDIN